MSFDPSALFLFGLLYLSGLFAIAHICERGWIPEKLIRHPLVFSLSLGVVMCAWIFYGIYDLAYHFGYAYLTFFFGISLLLLFSTVFFLPIARISRKYQLNSLADLLAFRFRSQAVGVIVSVVLLFAMLPLLALQIKAISESVAILTSGPELSRDASVNQQGMALTFCILMTLFTMLFGSSHIVAGQQHKGLVAAIAFESLTKLLVMLGLGVFVLTYYFGNLSGLQEWLYANPHHAAIFSTINYEGSVRFLLLLFFATAVIVPYLSHMFIAERPNKRALLHASWGFPLLMLLLSLPVPILIWGLLSQNDTDVLQYAPLLVSINANSSGAALAAYIGGVSAASSAVIVCTIALASMCLNHLVLAIFQPAGEDIYTWLQRGRRVLILLIIVLSYLFFRLTEHEDSLSTFGIAAFGGAINFIPGIVAMLYWPAGNRQGLIGGLGVGFLLWTVLVLFPMLGVSDFHYTELLAYFKWSDSLAWQLPILLAFSANCAVFIIVSLLSDSSVEEIAAAEVCSTYERRRPLRYALDVKSVSDVRSRLKDALGESSAKTEVDNALRQLNLPHTETRPYALRRLREQLEANLSGLLGPSSAYEIVNRYLPFESSEDSDPAGDIQFMEMQIDVRNTRFTGLNAELDDLRRYHRQVFQSLPIGACIISNTKEISMWNSAMEILCGISAEEAVGSDIVSLAAPWANVLLECIDAEEQFAYKQCIVKDGEERWISLHKSTVLPAAYQAGRNDQLVVLEDLTETQRLEQELAHSERLASVGRLAAGVAHEIGNPVTGIACIAQNIASESTDADLTGAAGSILQQTQRISSIVQTLMNFSHAGTRESADDFKAVSVKQCFAEAFNLLRLDQSSNVVNFKADIDSEIRVYGDEQRLMQVFLNLLANARDASEPGGIVEVSTEVEPQSVIVHVSDQGSGIPSAQHEQIFEPFYTTKQVGEGTGLGLALAYSIIEDHSGQISVHSPIENGRGARMSVTLPKFAAE